MKASLKYAGTAASLVALTTVALWPFLDPTARRGVVVAGAIALPTQIAAFWLLLNARGRLKAFLVVWVGGTLMRLAIVGLVAFLAYRSSADGAVAMLLALAGFFFALLLLEPIYFGPEPERGAS